MLKDKEFLIYKAYSRPKQTQRKKNEYPYCFNRVVFDSSFQNPYEINAPVIEEAPILSRELSLPALTKDFSLTQELSNNSINGRVNDFQDMTNLLENQNLVEVYITFNHQ